MGGNRSNMQQRHKQYNGSGLPLLSNPINHYPPTIKPSTKRMEKIAWSLLNIFFPTGYGLILLLNIDNIKGIILFIIAVLYGSARLFFYVIRQNQERRMRELDILEKQQNLHLNQTSS